MRGVHCGNSIDLDPGPLCSIETNRTTDVRVPDNTPDDLSLFMSSSMESNSQKITDKTRDWVFYTEDNVCRYIHVNNIKYICEITILDDSVVTIEKTVQGREICRRA